ncbi:MAG: ThuA domain-containing protein [Planctomycetota bacterium]
MISLLLFSLSWLPVPAHAASDDGLVLKSRSRAELPSGDVQVTLQTLRWEPAQTAIIVCDMWDAHWCRGATRRVAELAPVMNRTLAAARARGVLVIHAPSSTMAAYEGTPARKNAQSAPEVTPPVPLEGWCHLDPGREAPLPIDDSDGGCDCEPRCEGGSPWTRQVATIDIRDEDAISDSGTEIVSLMQQRGIENVIVMGVHTNMCVLGRPFAIRQLVRLGKNVVLMRDHTDTMYSSRSEPYVDHFRGTDLVIEHIERYWCPTITSTDLTGEPPFRFAGDVRKKIALVIAEDEYDAKLTLPAFAARELEQRFGFDCFVIQSESKTDLSGLERLADADLMILFARRRTLPKEQLVHIRRYVESGKPIIGLRTASHAFENWPTFDPDVLGGRYHGHHGNKSGELATRVRVHSAATSHPIVRHWPSGEREVTSWLYKTSPLVTAATPLLMGRVADREPHEPVAWIREDGRRVFYTSLGHPADFEDPAFRELLADAVLWALSPSSAPMPVPLENGSDGWTPFPVPSCWEESLPETMKGVDGVVWVRCRFELPDAWAGSPLELRLGSVDDCDVTFFNGTEVGRSGSWPPDTYRSATGIDRRYRIPAELVRAGALNQIAIRIYDGGGRGGFKGAAPMLQRGAEVLSLEGDWELRVGDDAKWAQLDPEADESASLEPRALESWQRRLAEGLPLSPEQALQAFQVADDLEVSLAAAEPDIVQPVEIQFDGRGRMWIVQYIQYMYPAGLEAIGSDQWDRRTYDRKPEPPPHGPRGLDRITIAEDKDGDGRFEHFQDFVTGLNLATSIALAKDGVYAAQTPYLLFYPDADHDDVPDGEPRVVLEGFGMEDAHAVVSSLTWGPDGWLYGGQGSTVTANVRGHEFQQAAWRYHPGTDRFEVFAEGGGNTFGLELDAEGQLLTGTNWGNYTLVHYVQGGYYFKNFGKHGPLHHPFAYGFFPHAPHLGEAAGHVAHAGVIYQGGALPERYDGQWIMLHLLGNRVCQHDVQRVGSSFRTEHVRHLLTTDDRWFRPVDIVTGPDGAIYVADWYDQRATHLIPEDTWDKTNGRVYRLSGLQKKLPSNDAWTGVPEQDLRRASSDRLVALLDHPNDWFARTARRLLDERDDPSVHPALEERLFRPGRPRLKLQALWALSVSGGFDETLAARTLAHSVPAVRAWTVRLLADFPPIPEALVPRIAELARAETDPSVLSQIASSARRLPAEQSFLITREMWRRQGLHEDPHLPLLIWWATEAIALEKAKEILNALATTESWQSPLLAGTILPRLARRYVAAGGVQLESLAILLESSPGPEAASTLLRALDEELGGRFLDEVPDALKLAIDRLPSDSSPESRAARARIGLRMRSPIATAEAIRLLTSKDLPQEQRIALIQSVAEVGAEGAVPSLLILAANDPAALRDAALGALVRFEDDRIPIRLLTLAQAEPAGSEARRRFASALVQRATWTSQLAAAFESGDLSPADLGIEGQAEWARRQGRSVDDGAHSSEQRRRVELALSKGDGDAAAGTEVFEATCARCHRMGEVGENIGPDLTQSDRSDRSALLTAILEPSAGIREGYEDYLAVTEDGLWITGFLVEQSDETVTLEDAERRRHRLRRGELEHLGPTNVSRMPEGLLTALTDQQIRDLMAFLQQ